MDKDVLHISVVQSHIVWENRTANLKHYDDLFRRITGTTDLVVLPEMFATGFSTTNAYLFAETNDGMTIRHVKQWASTYGVAIVGSFIAAENDKRYNRAFFITPDGKEYYYDKHHLFGMGGESKFFEKGNSRLIVNYRGWKICPLICYDLRFPVWSRNVKNEYDLLIYVANWPRVRSKIWLPLLQSRAVENMAYVCGVNCVGEDGNNITYIGGSSVFTPKGERLLSGGYKEVVRNCKIEKTILESLRTKFPAWKDADSFSITEK